MNSIKLIHTADWHLSEKPKLQQKARHNLDQMLEYVATYNIDGILLAGDIWDRLQPFGNNSAIKIAYKYLSELSKLVKFIFIIKGNTSHDAQQSIELLHQYKENIFAYENNVACGINLSGKPAVDNLFEITPAKKYELILHGISYPSKAELINSNSIDRQNNDFINCFESLMTYHGSVSKCYPNIPKVTMFHGNISGSKLSSGQTLIGQDIIIPSFVLEKSLSNYYALGHIHLSQNIISNMRYCGSLYNKDFGEIEEKSFDVINFNGLKASVNSIAFKQSRPMIVIDAIFEGAAFFYNKDIPKSAEIKFRYRIKENDRNLLTAGIIKELKNSLGQDVILEANVIPNERHSRTNRIMHLKTLYEEVEEYSKVIRENLPATIREKLDSLELAITEEPEICD